MQRFNKAVALLLCMVMLIGFVPVSALAADNTVYVLAGGDFQEADDHANSAANVTNILAQISQKYDTMDGFLFIGDYDCETHDSATETANGITALMGAVQGSYSNLNDANSVLVQGNHDYMDSRIDATGGHEFDGYAAYVLNEDDYPNGGGSQAGIQTLANNLKTWLNNKIGEGYSAPIFIVSHLPLAYTPRTVTQGDAKYAKYIFDVLNDAGKNGLNIIFLHGHDHAYGPDNYMGGEAIYLPVGDKICIAEAGSTSAWTEETLNFTYMNAGYTGYYSDAFTYVTTAGTDKLTMTVFAITDNEVTVERYSEDGLYNLKSAGYDGSYSNTSVTNVSLGLPKYENVYASPQTIALTEAEDYGDIGSWVGVTAEPTDDVTISGNDWTTITEPVAGSTTYEYTQATSITAGEEYVIVGNSNTVALMDNNGSMSSQNVTISGSTMTSNTALTEWTFSGSTSGTIYNGTRYLRYSTSVWSGSFNLSTSSSNLTFTDNGSNFRIYNNASYGTDYSFYYDGSSWTRSSSNQYVRLYQLTDVTTTGGTNGLYAYLDGELTYPVEVGTSADDALAMVKEGIAIRYATAADYSDEQTFPDDGDGMTWTLDPNYDPNVPGDYAVTISFNGTVLGTAEVVVPASTTYYAAEGNGLYLVDMNTTEDNAMAAVMAGVTIYSATDANGSNKTAIGDDEVTWEWVDKYNGADSGPYTVEILKDGESLGTVEVKVDVRYETGIETDWTYIGETEATGGSYTYTLDTDGIDSDGQYIIVAESQALALHTSGSSAATAVSVNISSDGKTLTTDTRDYEYYWNTTYGFTRDGYNGLYQSSWAIYLGTKSASYLDGVVNHNNGKYTLYDNEGNERGLYYNGSSWTVNDGGTTTDYKVRLYKYTGTTGGTPGGPIYALIEGPEVYTVTQGSSATKALAAVKAGITGYTATDANGTGKTELSDSDLTWKWKNTFNGNSTGSYWVEISYQDKVLGTVEVRVEPGVVNNYPEYPDEGAVKVGKTGTGIDFQSSGIAQVEISASGIPIKKGADVIVMLDTSSSMRSCMNCSSDGKPTTHDSYVCPNGGKTRAQALEESLGNLISYFKTPGADGEPMDIKVAIADFNGYYGTNANTTSSGAPYVRDLNDRVNSKEGYHQPSGAQVYTGSHGLDAGAFVDAANLAANYDLKYTSGTNYDYAFDAIYQLGHAIRKANEAAEVERDLYVIFMSDGAALQWNYFASPNDNTEWNNWLTGAWDDEGTVKNHVAPDDHAYYYDLEDHNGDGMRNEHRMANAVKGDPNEKYQIIRKATNGLEDVLTKVGGPGEDYLYEVPGLGATMYAINLDARTDGSITEENIDKAIASLASPQVGTTKTYYKVNSAAKLDDAFDAIGSEIAYAAYNARFVDQMGDDYDLQMKFAKYTTVVRDENGNPVDADGDGKNDTEDKTITPKIEIISYDIYTRQDYLNGTITEDKIGDRKGTYKVLETVTFNADGTEAYSDQINGGQTNILADGTQAGYVKGVIYAKTFLYNTNATGVAIDGVSIPTGKKADGTTTGSTNVLPAETFYWKMGTVQTFELAMRYYVYLTGSMEGTRAGGSYPTNEYATLYYDNYLGNPCQKDTVSPVIPWKEANVSYAFYLVDENGNIIVNQTTGQTGSFANKIAVTNPVVYETVLLNSDEEVSSIDIASLGVLPEGYTLFDYDGETGATYTVNINSNTTGSWEITSVKDVATTYVTQYDPKDASAYSNAPTNNTVGDDYTHTVVWFAVLWKVQALPDTVVIDYGLPVDISVLANDMFGENGKLAGVGTYTGGLENTTAGSSLQSGFGTSYTGTYGTAKADTTTGKVRYTPANMQMDSYEKFAYAVNYTGNENAGYYYDTVTVIPATTIYYEDSFLTFVKYNADGTASGTSWDFVGEAVEGATQSEDRPGQYSLTDANNIYGYDGVNLGMSQFSLGQARRVHVDANSYATAAFTFYGTGFDVISMTSNTSGVLSVEVKDQRGASVKKAIVNTYYGYTLDAEGNWISAPNVENSIYQVPVIQIEELTYGKYDVLITATYMSPMDKTTADGYDLYLDAIRIYDPAYGGASDGAEDSTIEDAYLADHEGWPSYIELRNGLISKSTLGNADTVEKLVGEVFIDGESKVGDAQIADYVSYGPNNEVYLASGQSIAFIVNAPENIDRIHIGVSSADGNEGTYTIKNIARNENTESGIKAGQTYGEKTYTVNTSTDMYYDMTSWKNDIVVITNTGDSGIISLTNIKSTYISNPADNVTTIPGTETQTAALNDSPLLRMAAAPLAVNAEQETTAPAEVVETAEPELTYVYMTAEAAQLVVANLNADAEEIPDETEPEETEPTVPDETEPEETEPTVPDETEPEETEPTVPDETEPEETEPTVPEETEPEVFEPAYVHVKLSKTSIKVGQKVLVTVTTSADVDHVIINGTVVTAYATGSTGNRIWKRNVTGTVAGTLMIDVTCCNASDVAAQTVTRQVKVSNKTIWDYIFDLFD